MIILSFQILFLVYFFVGVAIMKYRGASGFELIPDFYFWSNLPGNIKVTQLTPYFVLNEKQLSEIIKSST